MAAGSGMVGRGAGAVNRNTSSRRSPHISSSMSRPAGSTPFEELSSAVQSRLVELRDRGNKLPAAWARSVTCRSR